MKRLKRSVALVIEGPEGLLLVRRPEDDESLPGEWGLPAATLRERESEEDAVRRAGREKLGVQVRPLHPLGAAEDERPDGKGYPAGLTDADIPLEAKIIAVADAYEAMTADRVYRPGIGTKAARVELLRCAGTQFDARVIAAFMAVLEGLDREPDAELAGLGS